MKKLVLLLFSLCLTAQLYSQHDSTYFLPKLQIYQKEKSKIVCYSFEENDHNKFLSTDSLLIANPQKYNYSVKIKDIDKIAFRDGTNFWPAAGVGSAIGFVAGFFFGGYFTIGDPGGRPTPPAEFNPGGAIGGAFIFAASFGLVGGLIGLLAPAYDDYELTKYKGDSKADYLRKVFNKKKVRTGF